MLSRFVLFVNNKLNMFNLAIEMKGGSGGEIQNIKRFLSRVSILLHEGVDIYVPLYLHSEYMTTDRTQNRA